ncbi:MAG: hypothetical protein BMS9Abin25_0259 [Gammaproteobacteria bacterium]|nr:MAG: hypothetical protein BMS9Abin25_0259 [Gammaproteobacteria bacterium]
MTKDFVNNLKCSENLHLILQDLIKLQNMQLFFLGGFIKSGTTWIERLLDAHPEIACKGEAHFPSLLEPAVRKSIAQYNSVIPNKGNWERLKNEDMQQIQASEYCYTEKDFDNISTMSIQLLMSKWCNESKIRAVGEKTPNNAQYFPRLLQLFPGAKYIYIVRDIRDVIVSGWFFNLALDSAGTMSEFRSIHHYGIVIAQNWVQELANTLKFVEQYNSQAMVIKYEDLWHDPQKNTGNLLQFLAVKNTEELVKSCLHKTNFSTLSGGRKRGNENRGSFYRKGIIGDWKNHLKHETLVEIEMYCGAMLDHLDYEQYRP